MNVSLDHPKTQLIPAATENGCVENASNENDINETLIVNTSADSEDITLLTNVTSDTEQMSSLNKKISVSSQKDSSSSVKKTKCVDGVRPLECTSTQENDISSKQIVPENENDIQVTNGAKTDVVMAITANTPINDNSKYGEDKKLTGSNEVNSLSCDTVASPDNENSVVSNDCKVAVESKKDHTDKGPCDVKSPNLLSSIGEEEISEVKRTSLPLKVVNAQERSPNTGKRRNTNPAVSFHNKNVQPLIAKDVDIKRIMSTERHPTRSGFGGTADFDGKKPSLTPPERLKLQLKSGKKPHPLIILPDTGHFWCDPPQSNMSNPKYFLSCFDMEKQWKEIYGDGVDIVINPSETAADAYVSNFSQVIFSYFV